MEALHIGHKKRGKLQWALLGLAGIVIIFLLGFKIGNDNAGTSEGVSTVGWAVSTFKGPDTTGITTQLDGTIEELELPIENDLEITTTHIVITTDNSEISITNENSVNVEGFTGKLTLKNDSLIVEGKAKSYSGQNTNIDWENVRKVKFTVLAGAVNIENFEMRSLEITPEGELSLENGVFTLDQENLNLRNYEGKLTVSLESGSSTLNLDGTTTGIQIDGKEFTATIKN